LFKTEEALFLRHLRATTGELHDRSFNPVCTFQFPAGFLASGNTLALSTFRISKFVQAQTLEVHLSDEDLCVAASQSNGRPSLPRDMTEFELDHLFATCIHRLRRSAMQMLRSPEDCEDALQEGLLQAFRKLDQFEGRSQFTTWVYTIVRNAAGTHLRRVKCRPQCSWDEILSSRGSRSERVAVDPRRDPEGDFAYSERSRILRRAMRELPPKYQSVMRMCDVDGLDPKDAARSLGMSKSSLKTYLFRARRLVTKRIREKYVLQNEPIPSVDGPLRAKCQTRQAFPMDSRHPGGHYESASEAPPDAKSVLVHLADGADDGPHPTC